MQRPGEVSFVEGGGEMGALVRGFDWAATSLGPPSRWPASLRSVVRLMLASSQPMLVWWGDELIQIYNDAYRAGLPPEMHPSALGAPAAKVWDQAWDRLGPQVAQVMAGGGSAMSENQPATAKRGGSSETTFWTYSLTPIHDDSRPTGVGGVLAITTDVSAQNAAAQVSMARARRLLSSMSEGYIAMDGDLRVLEVNAEAARLAERSAAEMVGRRAAELWPDFVGAEIDFAFRQALTERRAAVLQLPYAVGGREVWLEVRVHPLEEGVAAFYRDVTATRQAENALRESEARLRIAQEAGGIGAYEWDLVTGELYASEVARRIWGFPKDEPLTLAKAVAMIHPEDRPFAMAAGNRPIEQLVGGDEYRIIHGETGEVRWLARHVELVRDGEGRPIRAVGAFRDITRSKRFEEQQQLLIHELNHRVKNTLATVQSIFAQTLRAADSLEGAKAAIEERLLSLARAHDVLTRRNWEGAGLREIVAEAVAPYRTAAERITVSGPDVGLSPRRALAMAMALQELATNAAKYGGLSRPGGCVDIGWTVHESVAGRRLKLRWAESGGPLVETPLRRGFGSRLLERGLAGEIEGEVRLEFASSGLICLMDGAVEAAA